MDGVATLIRLSRPEVDGELAESLNAVGEATSRGDPKYQASVQRWLVRTVVCRAYAKPIFELANLVAIAETVFRDRGYESLFWDRGPAAPAGFRRHFERAVTNSPDTARHIRADGIGIHAAYSDGSFTVTYARMPFLSALMDFLVAAIGYEDIDDRLRDALKAPLTRAALTGAANGISRMLYAYLKPRLPTAQAQRKFRDLMAFLRARTPSGEVGPEDLDDDRVFEFWKTETERIDEGGDWRNFRTVFGAFINLREAIRKAADQEAVASPLPIDPDRDADDTATGWVMDACAEIERQRESLDILRCPPANAIKFLNKRESETVSLIVRSGDGGLAMPLSLLRAEVFGAVQAAISQGMRRGDDPGTAATRACGGTTKTYCAHVGDLDDTLTHMDRALEAAYHVLARAQHSDAIALALSLSPNLDLRPLASTLIATARASGNAVALGGAAVREGYFAHAGAVSGDRSELGDFIARAANAHHRISRKGFTPKEADDPAIVEGFSAGANALLAIKNAVSRYRKQLDRLMPGVREQEHRYHADRSLFYTQFRILYGGTP